MKKIICGIICVLGSTLNSFAQKENRISYSFGFVSHAYHLERANERKFQEYTFPGVKDHGIYEYTDEDLYSMPIVFNLQYDRSLREHIGVGFCMGYECEKMNQETNFIKSAGDVTSPFGNIYTNWIREHRNGELKRHILYIMPEATVYWFKKRHVAMYTKAAVGVRFNFEKRKFYNSTPKSDILPNTNSAGLYFHVSPVAVEVGGPSWRGVIEIGYGAQGIIQYGVKHIFKGKRESLKTTY